MNKNFNILINFQYKKKEIQNLTLQSGVQTPIEKGKKGEGIANKKNRHEEMCKESTEKNNE